MRKSFGYEQLVQVRALPLLGILDRLKADGTLFWRRDMNFVPEKDSRTMRLFISVPSGLAWEMLITDLKWYDIRVGKGGGGGIDLVMYLLGVDFVAAVTLLLEYVGVAHQVR